MGEPLLAKLLDLIGETVPKTVMKHPVLTATGVGALGGGASLVNRNRKSEDAIMREYTGSANSKYSSADFSKFAERKDYLSTKISFIKLSDDDDSDFASAFVSGAGKGTGGGIISEGLGLIRRLLGRGAQAVHEGTTLSPMREEIYRTLTHKDPIIANFERSQPGQARLVYNTMQQVAPQLSTDPNVVRSFMRNAAMTDGTLDFPTIKGLADAEAAVHKARAEYTWGNQPF